MANYKKLTDVEVMEEVSENTMALVEDNGKLKKVPCGKGFGGGSDYILIHMRDMYDLEYDITYEEFSNMIQEKRIPLIIVSATSEAYPNYANFNFCNSIEPYGEAYYLNFYEFTNPSYYYSLVFTPNGLERVRNDPRS